MTAGGENDNILEVDLGNSACKYRFGTLSGQLAHSEHAAIDVAALDGRLRSRSGHLAVDRLRVCSVLGEERTRKFLDDAFGKWFVRGEVALSVASAAGVVNGYRDPGTLGVDRWLAIIAAFSKTRCATLVVDLGTAITLDYIDDSGTHLGGYIVPGTRLMESALLNDTAAVEFSKNRRGSSLQPGRSTQDAVSNGVLLMVRNCIEVEVDRFSELCHHAPRLVLCGGGAEVIAPYLPCPYDIVPELVLDGLRLALP